MDHRHTEDFARRMEAAALRAGHLRSQAADAFWRALAGALLRAAHRMLDWLAAARRAAAGP